jgi:hypothetical protein
MKNWIRKYQLVSFFVLTYIIGYLAGFGYIYLRPGQPLMPWSLTWQNWRETPLQNFHLIGQPVQALFLDGNLVVNHCRLEATHSTPEGTTLAA